MELLNFISPAYMRLRLLMSCIQASTKRRLFVSVEFVKYSAPRRLERLSHQLVILQRLSVSARATPSPTGKNATINTARTNQLSMLPVSKMHM